PARRGDPARPRTQGNPRMNTTPRPTKTRRRTAAVTAGLGLAPLIAVMLPATAAHAHGYVSAPPSRQAQCAQGIVDCGAIRWEPQSVEGPKGLRSCSGGNARFGELDDDGKGWQAATGRNTVTFTWTFPARHRTRDYEYNGRGRGGAGVASGGNARFGELDDDGKGWQAATVGNTVTFTWTFTARHRTRDYEYYVGGRRVAVIDGGDRQPPATVSHTVDLGGVSGRQKVLAVWNIADTANAFYACVDLEVR